MNRFDAGEIHLRLAILDPVRGYSPRRNEISAARLYQVWAAKARGWNSAPNHRRSLSRR
jgi:hypothetical protein